MKNTKNTLQNDYLNHAKCNYTCTYHGLSYNSYNINLYFNRLPETHDNIIELLELYIIDNVYSFLGFGYHIHKIDIQGMHAFISININTD